MNKSLHLQHQKRGVAQLASVPAWGAGGRPFESDHPDEKKQLAVIAGCFFCFYSSSEIYVCYICPSRFSIKQVFDGHKLSKK